MVIHAEGVVSVEDKPLWKMLPLDPIFDGVNIPSILDIKVSSDHLTSCFLTHQGLLTWDGDQLRNVPSSSWPDVNIGSEMTWSEVEGDGGWLVASGNRIWRIDSDLNTEDSDRIHPPDLPSGVRCVELEYDGFGAYWARSSEAIYTWSSNKENASGSWRKIPGSPQRFDLPVGDSSTMQADRSGNLWVTGYPGSVVGIWTLRKSSERWVEISIPESQNSTQAPLLARQQSKVSDPVFVWGNAVGVLENGAWKKLGSGVWETPIMAAWVGESSEKQLWLWDQSDGALKLWLQDSNETLNVPLEAFGKGAEPEFLIGAPEQDGVWMGLGGRVTYVKYAANGRYDWSRSGIHLNPETVEYSSTPGKWLALSSDGKSVYEVCWKSGTHRLSPGKVELFKVFGPNKEIGANAEESQQGSPSFRINSLMVESNRIWLATSHGIWRLKLPGSTQLQQFQSDPIHKQPPMPVPSSALFQPSFLLNEASSPLDKSSIQKIGRIPGAGLWAIVEDGNLYWIWTSEESENPSWIQSQAPWKFSDPNRQIIAISPTEALIWNHGVWALLEAKYQFVSQTWNWSREFLSLEFDQNPAPISWRLNQEQALWSHSQGWTSFQKITGQLKKHKWDDVAFEDRVQDVLMLGGASESIAGWMLRESSFWKFGLDRFELAGSGLATWSEVDRILELSRFGEDSSHVFLLGPENLIAWPTRSARKTGNPVATSIPKLTSPPLSTFNEIALEPLISSQQSKPPAVDSYTQQSPEREASEWFLYVLGLIGIMFLVLGAGPFRHQFLALSRREKGNRSLLHEAKKRKSRSATKSDFIASAVDMPDHDDLYWQSLGHELRTPLNAILGYAELLEEELEEGVSESAPEDLKRIISAARRELTLVRAFVDYSSSSLSSTNNRQPVNFDNYRPLNESVSMALRHVQPLAASKRCEIVPALVEPLSNGSFKDNGNGSIHSGSKVSPETVRALEYFLEAGVHLNAGGCLKWELVESAASFQNQDQNQDRDLNRTIIPNIPVPALFTLRMWCKIWPETVDSISDWLDGNELWRRIFTDEQAGLNSFKNSEIRQNQKQDAPLWKVCFALSELLARGQGGKLVCRMNEGIPNSAFGEEIQLVFSKRTEIKQNPT